MKIGHPPAFLFYVDDFSSDSKVEAMTTEQVGAYILLLCKSWRESPPGSLPSNDSLLARWARVTLDRWSEIRDGVLCAFTFGTDSRWHQKRQRAEYDRIVAIRKSRVVAAKSRWVKEKNANAVHKECISFSSSSSKKEKTNNAPAALPDWLPHPAWDDWVEMRRKIRGAPFTARAQELALGKLGRLRDDGYDPRELLENCLLRGWRGIFPPTDSGNGHAANPMARVGAGPTGARVKPAVIERVRNQK